MHAMILPGAGPCVAVAAADGGGGPSSAGGVTGTPGAINKSTEQKNLTRVLNKISIGEEHIKRFNPRN
jgi:hypothetical protein